MNIIKVLFFLCLVNLASAQTNYLDWSYTFGGSDYDLIRSTAIDPSGNVINVGYYRDTVDFAQGFVNDVRIAPSNITEMFIQKINPNGGFIWVKTFPCDSFCTAHRVITDTDGSIYVSGFFSSDSIDIDPSPLNTRYLQKGNSSRSLFLIKLDSLGNLKWARAQRGSDAYITDMVLDQFGEIFLIGSFPDTLDANPNPLIDSLISPMTIGKNDLFIEKLDTAGNFLWFKSIKSVDDLMARDMTLNSLGEPVIVGYFRDSVDFDPGSGIAMERPSIIEDKAFILQLDRLGNFKSVGRSSGAGPARYYDVEINPQDIIHIAGYFKDNPDLDPTVAGDIRPSFPNTSGWMLARLNSAGTVQWLKTYQTANIPSFFWIIRDDIHISLDPDDNIFMSAYFKSYLNFDPTDPNSLYLQNNNGSGNESHTFIAKIDSSSKPIWAYELRGEYAFPMDMISLGYDFYLTGYFSQNIRLDPFNIAAVNYGLGFSDPFLARFNSCKSPEDTILFEYVCDYYEVAPGQRIYKDTLLIDTVISVGDCYNLVRKQIDIYDLASVTLNNNTLNWDSSGVGPFTFSWYDCGLKQIVAGENDSTFKPTYNGQYALIVSDQNCTDTSDCYSIDDISLLDHSPLDYLSIHPNPTNGMLHLTNLPENEDYQISLRDLAGRKLEIIRSGFDIDISHLPSGVYLMTVQNGTHKGVRRIIKN